MNWRVVVMVAVCAALLASYGLLTHRSDDSVQPRAAAEPGWYLRDASVTDTNAEGAAQVELRAQYIQQDAATNNIDLQHVAVNYNGNSHDNWKLEAQRGHVPANTQRVDFSGEVVIRPQHEQKNPLTLRTQELSINTASNVATSATWVTTELNGQQLTGKGLHADLNTQRMRFLAAVEGTLLAGTARPANVNASTNASVIASAPRLECDGLELDARAKQLRCPKVRITQDGFSITANEGRAAGTDFENNQWTFTGKVIITTPDGLCSADTAVVTFERNVISRAQVVGKPAMFEQRSTARDTVMKGRALGVDYDLQKNTVRLAGDAWISNGQSEFTAAVLNYDIGTQRMSAPAEDQNGQKVRIVVQPAEKKPAADKKP